MNSIHYISSSVSDTDEMRGLRKSRSYGGLTLMWHKSTSKYMHILDMQNSRILGLVYKDNTLLILSVNVYLPTNYVKNRDYQMLYLGKLVSFIDTTSTTAEHVCILGNFSVGHNADYYNDIQEIPQKRRLEIADVTTVNPNGFTHVNQGFR